MLIPIAIVFVAIAVGLFIWSVKSGQFDDLDTEGKRILFDKENSLERRDGKGLESEKPVSPEQKGK